MRLLITCVLLATTLSGCTSDAPDLGHAGLHLVVDAPAEALRNASWEATGEVSAPAMLRVIDNGTTLWTGAVEGGWNVSVPLAAGGNRLLFRADDPEGNRSVHVNVTRLVMTTFVVDYGPDASHDTARTELWVDLDAAPSASFLAEHGRTHPGRATIMDLLFTWQNVTGTSVEFEPGTTAVWRIDGVGNPVDNNLPPWWCAEVAGAPPLDEPTHQYEIAAGTTVRYFWGSCGAAPV